MASAAILAGGRARRFGGRDKSALVVGGQQIVNRQLDVLRRLTDDILMVGTERRTAGTRTVRDRVPDSGPLGGLDAALDAARHDPLILVACDMPFITERFLSHLVQAAENVDAVVPKTERGYHPLCAVYRRSCRETVARHLKERRLKMVDLLSDLSVHVVNRETVVQLGGEQLLANVNTPDELDGIQALLGHEL